MKRLSLIAIILSMSAAGTAVSAKDFITYEEFGAVGDGKHDDQKAIIAAHAAANEKGLPVKATDGKTYYIGKGKKPAIIKTDTDWGKANFIVDDVVLEDIRQAIFIVESNQKPYTIETIKSLKKGQKKLGVKFPERSLVKVENKNKMVYIRKGLNQNNGHAQQEVFVVEKNGTIYPKSLPIFDYDEITNVTVYPIDKESLTIRGGIFTTIANQYPSQYKYHARNISIRRSNVIVDGITHYVKGELDHGAPYNAFISTRDAAEVIIRNCLLTAHKTYGTIGSAKKPVSMGSYDLGFGTTVNLHMENITQTNDINDKTYWGLMGSNYSKDIYMDNCKVSRFDAHQGVENVTLKNCEFGHMGVRMVGRGTIYLENCIIYTNYLLSLRSDYGSSWEGNIVVKNCSLIPRGKNTAEIFLLSGSNNGDHDFGYECMLPSVIDIDGLTIDDEGLTSSKYTGPYIFTTFNRDVTKSGLQPYKPTEKVILKNVTVKSGKEIKTSANTEMFKNVMIVK